MSSCGGTQHVDWWSKFPDNDLLGATRVVAVSAGFGFGLCSSVVVVMLVMMLMADADSQRPAWGTCPRSLSDAG